MDMHGQESASDHSPSCLGISITFRISLAIHNLDTNVFKGVAS